MTRRLSGPVPTALLGALLALVTAWFVATALATTARAHEVAHWQRATGVIRLHAAGRRPGVVYAGNRVLPLRPADVDDVSDGTRAAVRYSGSTAVLAGPLHAKVSAAWVMSAVAGAATVLLGVRLVVLSARRRRRAA